MRRVPEFLNVSLILKNGINFYCLTPKYTRYYNAIKKAINNQRFKVWKTYVLFKLYLWF